MTIIRERSPSKPSQNKTYIDSISDFPPVVDGVITLEDYHTYEITTTVDLGGARIVGGASSVLVGGSSENSKIKSTGLTGTAMISSEWSMPIRHILFEADVIFDLDATANANQALDWYGVNLISDNIGTIKNYNNFVVASMGFLGASGLVFDGTIGTIAFTDTLFLGSTGTIITIPDTANITRRFRLNNSAVIVGSGQTGLDVSATASIPVEGYILEKINFSGSGTYTAGVAYDDNKSLWSGCRGVINSATITGYYASGNATATTISAVDTPVKVDIATTEIDVSQKFAVTDNRATYTGAILTDAQVTVVASLTSGNNNKVGLYVAKNGTVIDSSETYVTTSSSGRIENCTCQTITNIENGDYIEVFVENTTSTTDVTVTDLNTIIKSLN